jgi:1-deoxy-D-xylulose-5-phosphate reductoisomerase
MKRKISILGSTGSIGRQALEVIEKLEDKFEIIALTAGHNTDLLNKQIQKFKPKYAYADDKTKITGAKYRTLDEICSDNQNDIILVAVSGKIGLKPTITAINNGIDIALANKETLVMAGDIVMGLAKEKGVNIIPVDSEHCAIHQCIKDISQVDKLIITASGGPFLKKTFEEMRNATVEQALSHPRWNMGKKITVDSATLMNKGLEVIEAKWLFGVGVDKIEVLVHPQSIVHSMVQFEDGSIKAQIGTPTMETPIQYSLSYPHRIESHIPRFSFWEHPELTFFRPDTETFRCLPLAYNAIEQGGNIPCVMNAANEVAVQRFIDGKLRFVDIADFVEQAISKATYIAHPTLDQLLECDTETRKTCNNI